MDPYSQNQQQPVAGNNPYASPNTPPAGAFGQPQPNPVAQPAAVPGAYAPPTDMRQPVPTQMPNAYQRPAAPQAAQPQAVVSAATPGTGKSTNTPTVKPVQGNPNSTQNSLQIAEIRDGIVIMNDGSFRSVIMAKSINFDLMSSQEQEAVEYSYQGFLNSLYFPVQIFVRSQKVDLQPYLEKLDKIRSEHDNMLLALLMEDYIQYMTQLSQQTNIMDKKFYVVIPYFPHVDVQKALTQSKNFFTGVLALFDKKEQHVVINEAELEKAKTELRNRVQAVLGGLLQSGVQALPLDTQELIELYYDTYNPDTATRQELKNFGNLTADIVTKGQGSAAQAHLQKEMM
ncbi:MAG TPA: hypothetical protein VLG11_03495 [Candidatus Saccharimonadales bacterium]|nr:hypothetical protein [Candidatus Saccharimonadales bacterium]